jgi:hypothetical protein
MTLIKRQSLARGQALGVLCQQSERVASRLPFLLSDSLRFNPRS